MAHFLQKRDPRLKSYKSMLSRRPKQNMSTSTRAHTEKQAESKKEIPVTESAASFAEQDWQKLVDVPSSEGLEGTMRQLDGDEDAQIFECIACNKLFQTEASFANHERSKKHKQNTY